MNDPTSLDTLIQYAGAVKALAEEDDRLKVGGYLVLFGTPESADLSPTKDFFTKSTDYGLDVAQRGRVRWQHGLDPKVGRAVLGLVDFKAEMDDIGVWAEGWIEKQTAYARKVAEWVKEGRAGWSTGVPAHCVGRKAAGKGTHEITEWCLGADCSITLTPADPRQVGGVLSLKAIMDTPASGLTGYDREPKAPATCPECGAEMDGDTCPKCGHQISADAMKDEVEAKEASPSDAAPASEPSTEDAAVAAKSLVDRSARLVADLDELVPLWERAHKARAVEGRDLSAEKQAHIKTLADRLHRLTVAVKPGLDRVALDAAFDEASKLNSLLAQL